MAHAYQLGRVAGLRLTAAPSAIGGSILLWILLSGIAALGLGVSLVGAIAGGLVAVVLHWASDIVTNLAMHARHAQRAIR